MWNRVFFTPSGGCEILSISHPCLYNISGIYLTIHNVWLDKLHRLKFSNVVALFNSVKFVFILYVWLFHFLELLSYEPHFSNPCTHSFQLGHEVIWKEKGVGCKNRLLHTLLRCVKYCLFHTSIFLPHFAYIWSFSMFSLTHLRRLSQKVRVKNNNKGGCEIEIFSHPPGGCETLSISHPPIILFRV